MPQKITKPSQLLRAAKRKLGPDYPYGKEQYICLAVVRVDTEKQVNYKTFCTVMNRIEELLGNCLYLEDWLVRRGHARAEEVTGKKNQRKMLRTRHKWIDHMIAEYEAQGM